MTIDKQTMLATERLVAAARQLTEKNEDQQVIGALLILSEHLKKVDGAGPVLQGIFKANGVRTPEGAAKELNSEMLTEKLIQLQEKHAEAIKNRQVSDAISYNRQITEIMNMLNQHGGQPQN